MTELQTQPSPSAAGDPVMNARERGFGRWLRRQRSAPLQLLIVLVILVLWQVLSGPVLNPIFISSPIAVGTVLVEQIANGYLLRHGWVTFSQAMVGFVLGGVIGIVIGSAMGLSKTIGELFRPGIDFLYTLPRIAIAPLFVLWFGIGFAFKVYFVMFVVIFLFATTVYTGLKDLRVDIVDGIKVMGGSRWQVLRLAVIPQEFRWIIAAVRISLPLAIATDIVAEFVASNEGLGFVMSNAAAVLNTSLLLATVVFLAIIITIILALVTWLERWLFRWQNH